MKRWNNILVFLAFATQTSLVCAGIVFDGNVDPTNSSLWNSTTNGYVGNSGVGSAEIDGGSILYSSYGYLGYDEGSSGEVTISDAGSSWISTYVLTVGYRGSGILDISDGAAVTNTSSIIASYAGSVGAVTVDGTGSTWTNSGGLTVGGSGNGTLAVTNGATVSSSCGQIGDYRSATGIATIDGPGSTWTNNGYLTIGFHGDSTLNILNGANVTVGTSTTVEYYSDATGMIDFGTNGGTLTTTSLQANPASLTGTGTINTHSFVTDCNLVYGSSGDLSQSFVLNSQSGQNVTVNLNFINSTDDTEFGVNHGSLTIQNGMDIVDEDGYIGRYAGSVGTATVSGAGSTWTSSRFLHVGYEGNGTLLVNNAANVASYVSDIGSEAGSYGAVTVTGTGSTWTNSDGLTLRYGTLTVSNGGTVHNEEVFVLNDSSVSVDGTGSNWITDDDLNIGGVGTETGTLSITNGGYVESNKSYLGYNRYYGGKGSVTVDGAGSVWDGGVIYVAYGENANGTVAVTNGAMVQGAAYVAENIRSTGEVTVDASTWTGTSLYVGNYGDGTFTATNGSTVASSYTRIGVEDGSTGVLTFDGAATTWTCSSNVTVGVRGDGTLNITNGATATIADTLYFATGNGSSGLLNFGSNGGTLTVKSFRAASNQITGTGTINAQGAVGDFNLLIDSNDDFVQTLTMNNQNQNITLNLDISNPDNVIDLGVNNGSIHIQGGMEVTSDNGYIGYGAGSVGTGSISGTGSVWNNSVIHVGYSGDGTLEITNGGTLNGSYGHIGTNTGSSGSVTVDAGATWNTYRLYLGSEDMNDGSGNGGNGTLTINDTGTVTCSFYTGIGLYENSVGELIVDGADAHFSTQRLTIGSSGSGKMIVRNGADFTITESVTVASEAGSTGELAVDGAGSSWSTTKDLYLGEHGDGTLRITNGSTVTVSGSTFVDRLEGSSSQIDFGTNGGTLTTKYLQARSIGLAGTGTVSTKGIVSDFDLVFNSNADLTQTFVMNDQLGQNVTINMDLSAGTSTFGVGDGSVTIQGGTHLTSGAGYVGCFAGSTGTATVSGNGSTWTSNGTFYVGDYGNATLSILDGGVVDAYNYVYLGYRVGSGGSVTVDGVGSTLSGGWVYVGREGNGTLEITNGGTVDCLGLCMGDYTNTMGNVTVDGAGSTINCSTIQVADSGSANFTIINGGVVNSNSAVITNGSGTTGHVLVDGAGSTWNTNGLGIGYYAGSNASLTITNGGVVNSTSASAEGNYGLETQILVDGIGSTWSNHGNLNIKRTTSVEIANGGLLLVEDTLTTQYSSSFIKMSTGGMLALYGDADDSLGEFFDLIEGTDNVQYWDQVAGDWEPLIQAIEGQDYTLEYFNNGELAGYTVLTVGAVPEPGCVALLLTLLATGVVFVLRRR